jgi:hypothetical protein
MDWVGAGKQPWKASKISRISAKLNPMAELRKSSQGAVSNGPKPLLNIGCNSGHCLPQLLVSPRACVSSLHSPV